MICMGVNTVCLAMENHGMSNGLASFLYWANWVLPVMFTIETNWGI